MGKSHWYVSTDGRTDELNNMKIIGAFRDVANVSKYYVEGKAIGIFNTDMTEYNIEKHGVAGALHVNRIRPHMC
jgi:hypothetical protein